jgi:hypothetical protein
MPDAGTSPEILTLPDTETWSDFDTYVGRAKRLDPDGAVRLVVDAGVLAAYVAPLYPAGIGDRVPTVLGLRTMDVLGPKTLDAVVPLAAMTDRFAREDRVGSFISGRQIPAAMPLPPGRVSAAWAGVSPPRGDWVLTADADVTVLLSEAAHGIREIAAALPEAAGAHVVSSVRSQVWGEEIPGYPGLPRGAAFAAEGLGFLSPFERVALYSRGPWRRLSSPRGHIIARRSASLG